MQNRALLRGQAAELAVGQCRKLCGGKSKQHGFRPDVQGKGAQTIQLAIGQRAQLFTLQTGQLFSRESGQLPAGQAIALHNAHGGNLLVGDPLPLCFAEGSQLTAGEAEPLRAGHGGDLHAGESEQLCIAQPAYAQRVERIELLFAPIAQFAAGQGDHFGGLHCLVQMIGEFAVGQSFTIIVFPECAVIALDLYSGDQLWIAAEPIGNYFDVTSRGSDFAGKLFERENQSGIFATAEMVGIHQENVDFIG